MKSQWARLLRWSIVICGILAAWLIPYQQYAAQRVLVSLALVGLGVIRDYEAVKRERLRDAKIQAVETRGETISATAEAASTAARTALRGRKLSEEQRAQIATRLTGVDLSGVRVVISYLPNGSEARDFAESLATCMTTELRLSNVWPSADNPNAGPQPRPPVYGTMFIMAAEASKAARQLAEVFASVADEIEVTGENPAWPFQTSIYHIRIVVGQKTDRKKTSRS